MQQARVRTKDEITLRHTASSSEIKPRTGIMPRNVKPRTRIRSYMVGQLHDMLWRTASLHSEEHASKEAGSPRALRAAMSGSDCVALKASFHSDRSRWSLARRGNFTQKWRHDSSDAVVPRRLKSQNARALLAKGHIKLVAEKSPWGARKPHKDVKVSGTSSRLPELEAGPRRLLLLKVVKKHPHRPSTQGL